MAGENSQLPPLREDLQLRPGPSALDGSPTWTLYDPLRGRFFRIGYEHFHMLSHWRLGTIDALLAKINGNTTCRLVGEDVLRFVRFLNGNNLCLSAAPAQSGEYLAQFDASRVNWLMWLVHHYLFFRIPLVQPERFLRATLPYVQWCFRRGIGYVSLFAAVLAWYLISRQWDSFVATFLHFFSWEGAALYGVALVGVKVVHELGHAYTATRYGCHVPAMGVAFVVMWPMLYTDTTDVWRLNSRRERLFVGAAGMLVESAVAILSTLIWSFLPDGSLRSAAFILATTSWFMTLTINLSPLMRFDGYYILADWWGVDNMQERAFSLGRWRLRRLLFGTQEEPPEPFPAPLAQRLTAYAWITWIYRLIVFTGIALLVYHLFFKLLGLVLFAVEIIWFVLRPIASEFRYWWTHRATMLSTPRAVWLGSAAALTLILLLLPWSSTVRFPAVMEPALYTTLYPPEASLIESAWIQRGARADAGQELLRLRSPKLDGEIRLSERRLDFYRLRMARTTTTYEESSDFQIATRQFLAESSRLAGLKRQQERLTIRAPFAGILTDVSESLVPGRWVSPKQQIAILVEPGHALVHGLVAETDVAAIDSGQTGRFVPADLSIAPAEVRVAVVGQTAATHFETPYLASVYDGPIAVRKSPEGKLAPTDTVFAVRLDITENRTPPQIVKGTVLIEAKPRSLAALAFEIAASVLLRESGF